MIQLRHCMQMNCGGGHAPEVPLAELHGKILRASVAGILI